MRMMRSSVADSRMNSRSSGGAGGIVEGDQLVGDDAAAAGEFGDTGVESWAGPARAAAGFVKDLADGIQDFGRVLGDEADGFAVQHDAVFAHGGFDGEIFPWGDADEFVEFEVDGAETVEEGDDAVGVAAAEGEAGPAEFLPGWGGGEVELLVMNAAEELGVGRRTSSSDRGEGATLAEETAEFEGLTRVGGDLRFVHKDSVV